MASRRYQTGGIEAIPGDSARHKKPLPAFFLSPAKTGQLSTDLALYNVLAVGCSQKLTLFSSGPASTLRSEIWGTTGPGDGPGQPASQPVRLSCLCWVYFSVAASLTPPRQQTQHTTHLHVHSSQAQVSNQRRNKPQNSTTMATSTRPGRAAACTLGCRHVTQPSTR